MAGCPENSSVSQSQNIKLTIARVGNVSKKQERLFITV